MFLDTEDFINKFELSVGMFSLNKLQAYIERYEKEYLVCLLGNDLYMELMSDLNAGLPQSPNFDNIFGAISEDWNYTIIQSKGIVDMLTGFVYFEYAKDLINQQTPFGNVNPKSENSDVASTVYNMMYNRYNESVKSYTNIQKYIYKHRDANTGQLVAITMTTPGTNITSGVYDVIGGSGTLGKLNVVSDALGVVQSVSIEDKGQDYQIGDQISVAEGNLDLVVNVDYVGIGDYGLFNGQRKQFNTWL